MVDEELGAIAVDGVEGGFEVGGGLDDGGERVVGVEGGEVG